MIVVKSVTVTLRITECVFLVCREEKKSFKFLSEAERLKTAFKLSLWKIDFKLKLKYIKIYNSWIKKEQAENKANEQRDVDTMNWFHTQ